MNRKIRWGIIGPGIIAHQFAHDFQYVSHGELVAVASRSKDRAKGFAEKYKIPTSYGSYEGLYKDPSIDVIYVATPHTFHLRNSIDAMSAGKAVLCEKPITISQGEFEDLIRAAENYGQYLMEGMWTYFLPAIRKAKEWVAEGKIGKIRHIKSDFGYPIPMDPTGRMYNPELAGGALLDMGIYNVAMAWLFCQKDPDQITSISHFAETGVNDDVTTLFEYDEAVAHLTTSFRCKLNNWAYVIGESGYIAIPNFWRARECSLYRNEECIDHFKDNRNGYGFNFEIDEVSGDLLTNKMQSGTMPLSTSRKLQEHLAWISEKFHQDNNFLHT